MALSLLPFISESDSLRQRKDSIQADRRSFVQSALLLSGGVLLSLQQPARAMTDFQTVLLPVVQISNELTQVQSLVRDKATWPNALSILQTQKYEKANFKKAFNQVGDNYAGNSSSSNGAGGPKAEQSVAYLMRNQVLTSVEDLRAELDYLLKDHNDDEDAADLYKYADAAAKVMHRYLELIPPAEVEQAQMALGR